MAWQTILILSIVCLSGYINAFRPRIFNGNNAKIEDFPYQVAIQFEGDHQCGGSIISERHILTAAHCITVDMMPPDYKNLNVITGTSYSDYRKGKIFRVSNITVHPDFDCRTFTQKCVNDIAVITLKNAIVFNNYQQKINLPENNYVAGSEANVTGYGYYIIEPALVNPVFLQKYKTKITSAEECQKNLIDPEDTKILDTDVCTVRTRRFGVCFGDSGGPLAVNGEIVGIVSWSDDTACGSNHTDVFVNVYSYKDFIKSVMNKNV